MMHTPRQRAMQAQRDRRIALMPLARDPNRIASAWALFALAIAAVFAVPVLLKMMGVR